jgi:hypothetical protein
MSRIFQETFWDRTDVEHRVFRTTHGDEVGRDLVSEAYEFMGDIALPMEERPNDIGPLEFFVHDLLELFRVILVVDCRDEPEVDTLVGDETGTHACAFSIGESDGKGECAKALLRAVDANHDAHDAHDIALSFELEFVTNTDARAL